MSVKIKKSTSFQAELNTELKEFLSSQKEKFPIPNTVDERIKQVIEKATEIDVEARLNMGELLELLENI